MGFRITIQADGGKELYISNSYGDFSVGPLDKLARKYRHAGTYDDQDGCFEVEIGNVDDLADALAEIQQIAEEKIGDRMWNLKPDIPYSQDSKQYVADQIGLDDGCYALVVGRVFNYLFEQSCLRLDGTTKSGFRLKDGKKIVLRGS
jgi:hypothetical protein